MTEKAIRSLYCAIYKQAYKDFIKKADVQDKVRLYDWLLNDGRVLFAPFLNKEKVRKKLDEYL